MKLSEQLRIARTNRPDEWTMDRFILIAEKYEKVIFDALTKEEAYNNGERVYGTWVKSVIDLIGEDEKEDNRFICPKCKSRNVRLRPMYGSISVCKSCNHAWKS